MDGFTRFSIRAKSVIFVWLIFINLQASNAFAQSPQTVFVPQAGTPARIANFVDPNSGCSWAGVGGQVFNQQGAPQIGLVIKLWGTVDGKNVQFYAVSGGSTKIGPGGFLVKIASHLVSTEGNLFIQVLDVSGKVIAGPVRLFTAADCAKNLLVINFKEMVYPYSFYFPITSYTTIPRNK